MERALVVFQRLNDPEDPASEGAAVTRSPVLVRRGGSELQTAVFGIVDEGIQLVDLTRHWTPNYRVPALARARPHVSALLDAVVLQAALAEEAACKPSRVPRATTPREPAEATELAAGTLAAAESNAPLVTPPGCAFLVVQWAADAAFDAHVRQTIEDRGIDVAEEGDDREEEEDEEDEEDEEEEDEEDDDKPPMQLPPRKRRR